MNTTLFGVYGDARDAERIVQELLDAGVARNRISLIRPTLVSGETSYHDRNVERQGTFADKEPQYHDRNVERQGTFADKEPQYHDRNVERQGSFADKEPQYHDRNVERQGTFADIEVTYDDHDNVIDMLTGAGIAPGDAQTCATHLQEGATLVVVRSGAKAEQAAAILHRGA